jgi:tripartite-type tricarboxylate transporter receptor subunit TctC
MLRPVPDSPLISAQFLQALCLSAIIAIPSGATAQTAGPASPLRIIVPLPAGATSDVLARALADALASDVARPVIVDNRAGASGRIAVDALRSATADAATVLLTPLAVPVLVPLVFPDVKYDPQRDLAPIAQVGTFEYALAVAPDHPARNLEQFVAWARSNAARATYGTPGAGGVPHLLGVLFARQAGFEFLHVPYRGASAAVSDVMGGRIAAVFSALPDLTELHRARKLRILATAGATRSPLTPEVSTFREQGFAAVEAIGWHALFAPEKTPQAAIDRLSEAIARVLADPVVVEKMRALGLEAHASTSAELAALVKLETDRWRPIVKAAAITAE